MEAQTPTTSPASNPTRAICPSCKEQMIFASILIEGKTLWAWLCDCRSQPDSVAADVADARLGPLTVLVYEVETGTHANEPT